MSKVEELRAKYPKITNATFKKFEEGDETKTKKYLPFMLKLWVNRSSEISNSTELVKLVNMFDELLPYIENKDIYHKDYEDITFFLKVINDAMDEKNEKTFVREEHANVLHECDEYILLQPLTHRGSLKYGANTKWCTSSKKDKNTFERYTKNGFLVYFLSKKEDKSEDVKKLAFFSNYGDDPLLSGVELYDSLDKRISFTRVVEGGWDINQLFAAMAIYRANFTNETRVTYAKQSINKAVLTLTSIDFDLLRQQIDIVEKSKNNDYISDIKEKINEFIKQIPVNI